MERIKQAIEDAKKLGPTGASVLEFINPASKPKETTRSVSLPAWMTKDLLKKVSAIALIFLSTIAWMRLDFLNQLELDASLHIHDGIKQASVEAKRRAIEKDRLQQILVDNLAHCRSTAQKAKNDYVNLVKEAMRAEKSKSVPGGRGKILMPRKVAIVVEKILLTATEECQQTYTKQLKNGK